jgi:hypothetical protein
MNKLDKEQSYLYGRQIVTDYKKLKLEEMALKTDLVTEGIKQLIEAEGNPKQQQAIVKAMDEEITLALCRID